MHAASLISFLLLGLSIANAAPVNRMKRLDDLTENINGVKDSTPVTRTCKLVDEGDSLRKKCGDFSVAGLTTDSRGVGLQIACLNDEATCLKDGKTAAECKTKRQTCEFENTTGTASTRLNSDGDSKVDFLHIFDPLCQNEDKAAEKPFICDVRSFLPGQEGEGAIAFTPSDKPSKFIEDNDAGNTLIGDKIKKGPIGEGLKTSVQDNGDGTFTAGNLTTFSRNFAIQLGCLFDEAECKKAGSAEDCNKERVTCEDKNKLLSTFLVISQTQTKP